MRIGLTGGIGSGKSTLARLLVDQGARLIDSDAIARELTAAGGAAIEAIAQAFGPGVIEAGGALDRARMRSLVFSDPAARRRLEALLHPMIGARSEQRAAELAPGAPYLVFDIPLLAEGGLRDGRFDRVLVIDCPAGVQMARALQRGTLSRSQIEAVMASQASRERRLAVADDVVFNAMGLADLRRRAERLHAYYFAFDSAPSSV